MSPAELRPLFVVGASPPGDLFRPPRACRCSWRRQAGFAANNFASARRRQYPTQGLYGRYTLLLNDGLPLYGGQAASIGLLQIPPTDLSQVEVIKGSASSFYGGSALGGVINLFSRRLGDAAAGEVLLNLTTQDGQDLTGFFETPISDQLAVSLTTGAHRQTEQDYNGDGRIDMPGYESWTARPRLFWGGPNGTRRVRRAPG